MKLNLLFAKVIFVFGVLFPFSSSSQINIAINHRLEDDGSSTLKKEDSLHIKKFLIENFGKENAIKNKSEIDFELINADQLKQICAKSKYTWVFIQSSWCGACINGLNKNRRTLDSLKGEGISIVVINQDIQIKQLQKKILMEKYNILSYIIDPKIYGTMELKKQEQFILEIANNSKIENNPGSVPKNLFLNQSGELVYFDTTYKINTNLIKTKVLNK